MFELTCRQLDLVALGVRRLTSISSVHGRAVDRPSHNITLDHYSYDKFSNGRAPMHGVWEKLFMMPAPLLMAEWINIGYALYAFKESSRSELLRDGECRRLDTQVHMLCRNSINNGAWFCEYEIRDRFKTIMRTVRLCVEEGTDVS